MWVVQGKFLLSSPSQTALTAIINQKRAVLVRAVVSRPHIDPRDLFYTAKEVTESRPAPSVCTHFILIHFIILHQPSGNRSEDIEMRGSEWTKRRMPGYVEIAVWPAACDVLDLSS